MQPSDSDESASSTLSRLPPAAGSAADESETFAAMTWAALLFTLVVGAMVGDSSRLFLGAIAKKIGPETPKLS